MATVLEFIGQSVESEESALITDEYKALPTLILMPIALSSTARAMSMPKTKLSRGFLVFTKRAWYGSHKYTKAEACWKYNHRKDADSFNGLLKTCFT